MTLIFTDSFDHYTNTEGVLKNWTYGGGIVTAAIGRNGTAGLRCATSSNHGENALPGSGYATIIVGFSFKSGSVESQGLIQLKNTNAIVHLQLRTDTTGHIQLHRGQNGTLLATGTAILTAGIDHYIEIKANIHDSTGSVIVRVDEATDINVSGVDTQNAGAAVVDTLRFGYNALGFGGVEDFDDLYVCDTAGSVNNDFLGDVRVQAIFPNANGNTSNLTGSDGNSTDNYLLVDEAAPNGDTDYVESSTVNDKDTYNYGALTPTSGTVKGVQINLYARKTDAGVRQVASIARHSATEVDSANYTLGSSYGYFRDIRETKPGGGAWSISDVNAAEFGVKVTA